MSVIYTIFHILLFSSHRGYDKIRTLFHISKHNLGRLKRFAPIPEEKNDDPITKREAVSVVHGEAIAISATLAIRPAIIIE